MSIAEDTLPVTNQCSHVQGEFLGYNVYDAQLIYGDKMAPGVCLYSGQY